MTRDKKVSINLSTCSFLHLCQHKSTNLAGRVDLALSFEPCITIGCPHYFVWNILPVKIQSNKSMLAVPLLSVLPFQSIHSEIVFYPDKVLKHQPVGRLSIMLPTTLFKTKKLVLVNWTLWQHLVAKKSSNHSTFWSKPSQTNTQRFRC